MTVIARDEVERRLELMRLEFALTGHPFTLWAAYRLARGKLNRDRDGELGPMPGWILQAFDEVAERCVEAREERDASDENWTNTIARVFGFPPPTIGTANDPFQSAKRQHDLFALAVQMRVLVDNGGHQPTYAAQWLAERYGISKSSVDRGWSAFAEAAQAQDLEQQALKVHALWEFQDRVGFFGHLKHFKQAGSL